MIVPFKVACIALILVWLFVGLGWFCVRAFHEEFFNPDEQPWLVKFGAILIYVALLLGIVAAVAAIIGVAQS